jgi:hypothetical protein
MTNGGSMGRLLVADFIQSVNCRLEWFVAH